MMPQLPMADAVAALWIIFIDGPTRARFNAGKIDISMRESSSRLILFFYVPRTVVGWTVD